MILAGSKRFNFKTIRYFASYTQGQQSEGIREYFYYINHEGMLFLDDTKIKNFTSCFKEKKFLNFFFRRIQPNKTSRYQEEFPYLSMCGRRECNFIRCEDVPIVFTDIIKDSEANYKLSCAHAGSELVVDFQPNKIYMRPDTGWIYHPAWANVGNIGLIRSKLAIEFSKHFDFDSVDQRLPTHFIWDGQRLKLDHDWVGLTQRC